MTWQEEAACAGTIQPELFTGENLHRDMEMCADIIAAFCAQCPVWSQCLEWAHEQDHFEGIAGGWVWTHKGIREPGKRLIPRNRLKPRPPTPVEMERLERRERARLASLEFAQRGWA